MVLNYMTTKFKPYRELGFSAVQQEFWLVYEGLLTPKNPSASLIVRFNISYNISYRQYAVCVKVITNTSRIESII